MMQMRRFHVDLGYLWHHTGSGVDFPIGQGLVIYCVPTDVMGEFRIRNEHWPMHVHLPCMGWCRIPGTEWHVAASRSWGPGEILLAPASLGVGPLPDVSTLPLTYVGSPLGSAQPRGLYALDNLDKEWG